MRSIVKFLGLIISLPFILLAISFAVSNTDPVPLRLWPFDTELAAPAALMVFVVLLLGFMIGAIASFLGAGKLRKRVRNAEYRMRQMEMEAARIKREQEASANTSADKSSALVSQSGQSGQPPVLAAE